MIGSHIPSSAGQAATKTNIFDPTALPEEQEFTRNNADIKVLSGSDVGSPETSMMGASMDPNVR